MSTAFHHRFAGRRVLVTGHTGFKGSWLTQWLLELGAKVSGFSLPPPTSPALFEQLQLAGRIDHHLGDVRDANAVARLVEETRPDVVFHLAAQPLVRTSYEIPLETYQTNVMGTAHVLDALRLANRPCVAVIITTDKCYENREWDHAYREEDPLGGYDPYSSSKACAELIVLAYRRSFFQKSPILVASARAGNVIGGGDWALDRIVPDAIRSLQRDETIPVRNPVATRPWQHVLEPLSGYLWLAARLLEESGDPCSAAAHQLTTAFNFGPDLASNQPVRQLVEEILKHWPGSWRDHSTADALHEAGRLNLARERAFHSLDWQPVWDFSTTIERTVHWYRENTRDATQTPALTAQDIDRYTEAAQRLGVDWAINSKTR